MASVQTAALHGAKYARDNSTLQISDVGTVGCQWSGFEPLRIWCIWCIDWVDGLSWWRFLTFVFGWNKTESQSLGGALLFKWTTLCRSHYIASQWIWAKMGLLRCLSSSVDFLFRPAPPLRPCCQLVGHSLPWHARVSMNIASEHVNKKHQKTKHLRLFLLKRHHCMIRFNLMQGTTKSGNLSPATYGSVSLSHRFCWRSSSLIHFAPCVRTAPYGPITKSIKKLQYFLHKQGSHRTRVLEGISCVYITIYQLTFMSQKPSGSGTPSPSSHQIVGACHMLYLGTMRRVCLEIGTPYLRQFSWNTMIKPWIFRGTSTTNPEWYENTCTIIYNLCVWEWSNMIQFSNMFVFHNSPMVLNDPSHLFFCACFPDFRHLLPHPVAPGL